MAPDFAPDFEGFAPDFYIKHNINTDVPPDLAADFSPTMLLSPRLDIFHLSRKLYIVLVQSHLALPSHRWQGADHGEVEARRNSKSERVAKLACDDAHGHHDSDS